MTLSASARTGTSTVRAASLIVTTGSRAFAIPVADVLETMRPLPLSPLAGAPGFVLGLAVIRGAPVPVVDLAAVVGGRPSDTIGRFVSLKVGARRVVAAVGTVLGVRELSGLSVGETPPLLRDAATEVIEAIGVLDTGLLLVLRASRLLPEDVWARLTGGGRFA